MDWTTMTAVIGSNFFIALVAIVTTLKQISHSDRRHEKELKEARDTDLKERRREVRSEPLLRLRTELARSVGKLEVLQRQLRRWGGIGEPLSPAVAQLVNDTLQYFNSAEYMEAKFIVDDLELIREVGEVEQDYVGILERRARPQDYSEGQLAEIGEMYRRSLERVSKIQSVINKKLEEL